MSKLTKIVKMTASGYSVIKEARQTLKSPVQAISKKLFKAIAVELARVAVLQQLEPYFKKVEETTFVDKSFSIPLSQGIHKWLKDNEELLSFFSEVISDTVNSPTQFIDKEITTLLVSLHDTPLSLHVNIKLFLKPAAQANNNTPNTSNTTNNTGHTTSSSSTPSPQPTANTTNTPTPTDTSTISTSASTLESSSTQQLPESINNPQAEGGSSSKSQEPKTRAKRQAKKPVSKDEPKISEEKVQPKTEKKTTTRKKIASEFTPKKELKDISDKTPSQPDEKKVVEVKKRSRKVVK